MGTKSLPSPPPACLPVPAAVGQAARLPWHCPQGLCSPWNLGQLPPAAKDMEPEGYAGSWVAQGQLGVLRVKPCQTAAPFPQAVPTAGAPWGPRHPQGPQGESLGSCHWM